MKKILVFAAAFIVVAGTDTAALADTFTLTKNSNMGFGLLEFDASHNGSMRLGTNGVVAVTGTGLYTDHNSSAGNFQIISRQKQPQSKIVQIRCSAGGQLRNSQGDILVLRNVEISVNSGAAFGNGSRCNGIGPADTPAAIIDLKVTYNPQIYIGAEMVVSPGSITASGPFSTSTGAQPVIINVINQ